jgi:hypothetical protein
MYTNEPTGTIEPHGARCCRARDSKAITASPDISWGARRLSPEAKVVTIAALSVIACLRKLRAPLRVGT